MQFGVAARPRPHGVVAQHPHQVVDRDGALGRAPGLEQVEASLRQATHVGHRVVVVLQGGPQGPQLVEERERGDGPEDRFLQRLLADAQYGERDERLPEIVSTGCETLVLEGSNGYGSNADDRLILENTAWPWLPPGGSLTIGWLRPAQASARPAPSILAPP